MRKANHSVYEISEILEERSLSLSPTAVREVLVAEGFAALPRRLDEERPSRVGPEAEAVADVRQFSLAPREFHTRFGGLFLFLPMLARLDLDALAHAARQPSSKMIPAAHALRACLALELWSIERKRHVMSLVADPGLGKKCGEGLLAPLALATTTPTCFQAYERSCKPPDESFDRRRTAALCISSTTDLPGRKSYVCCQVGGELMASSREPPGWCRLSCLQVELAENKHPAQTNWTRPRRRHLSAE